MIKYGNENKYMDGYYKDNLDLLNEAVDKNWDGVLYICGYEGDGKTTMGEQTAYYLDPTFCMDRCCFTPTQFKEACISATKKQCVMFDESFLAFNNKNWQDKTTKQIISLLTMIRKKQLFIIIIAPTFFDIQKYIAIHRSRALIQVYANGLTRGYFKFWNRERKHALYIKGKQYENYGCVVPNFRGRFTDWHCLDEKEYDKKKTAAINSYAEGKEVAWDKPSQYHLLQWLNDSGFLMPLSISNIARYYFRVTPQALNQHLLKIKADKETSSVNNKVNV